MILGYTFLADYHCAACTRAAAAAGKLVSKPDHPHAEPGTDEHDVKMDLVDREGNIIRPVFKLDELPCDLSPDEGGYSPVACGECGAVIKRNINLENPE